MENLPAALSHELPNVALHFSAYAQKLLDNSQKLTANLTGAALSTIDYNATTTATATATATATTTAIPIAISNATPVSTLQVVQTTSELLQKLSATIFNTIQLQALSQKSSNSNYKYNNNNNSNYTGLTSLIRNTTQTSVGSSIIGSGANMNLDFPPNHIVIDSSSFDAMDELQKQLAYDKLMNDVWIGVVLTLILISMVFCICSCFLYHQFRTWKRSYHSTVLQAAGTTPLDLEAVKLHADPEDPVPEYTLVSGLPSYEAALELLQKTPKSCLLVYPSVFNVFTMHEKDAAGSGTLQQSQSITEVTTPLLAATATAAATATLPAQAPTTAITTTMMAATAAVTTTPTASAESVKRLVAPAARNKPALLLPTYAEACETHSAKTTAGDRAAATVAIPPDTVRTAAAATTTIAPITTPTTTASNLAKPTTTTTTTTGTAAASAGNRLAGKNGSTAKR